MPRQVDQEARRQRIADAVCLLADEGGLEGVTLRDVAARADVSMGAVQRCFRTKEEMLVFALGQVGARVLGRAQARLAGSPAQSARSALGHAVTELSLLRREQHGEARVWLAFVAQAAVSPRLAGVLREDYEALQELVTGLVTEVAEPPAADPRREARALLALADGLTAHVLVGHLTPQDALGILDDRLRALWGGADGAPGGG
ncbi:TetR/AcrR family transcriptional regulator [Streptomyces lycii]|uniref:TetR family transcriptional regulator n=1 Tax=Streptomyces lycii TaxID=2654337 RepID=A0ABQ7FIH5_9ACTN|nr:TetR/AcrR family transcriptional regulator [Streptomyces lycii]KAF4408732.1 TetR family transcriptional regulator [Streptomyces lycii]